MGKRSTFEQPSRVNPAAVVGLEHARRHAAVQTRRRSRTNAVTVGIMAILALGSVGLAAFAGWTFYQSEVETDLDNGPTVQDLDPNGAIDLLENQTRWNGPGVPAFGVGEEPVRP